MRLSVAGFRPERLLQARQARGITQAALAAMVERTAATICKWEKGTQAPEPEALERISKTLKMPSSWFLRPVPAYGNRNSFFRSNTSITKEARTISDVHLQWLNDIGLTLQEWLDWPEVNFPTFDESDYTQISMEDIEKFSVHCRKYWKLGMGPISDIMLLLENNGAICVRLELGYTNMDGNSRWFDSDNRPYVMVAGDKANAIRNRFDATHELAHLVLHRKVDTLEFNKHYKLLEAQANMFAGAFLLPSETFGVEVTRPTLDTFLALKPRWKVSIAAMIMRCKQLQIIDEEAVSRLWRSYNARGWRKGEPFDDDIPFEQPKLMPRGIKLLMEEGVLTREGLQAQLGMNAEDCEKLCSLPDGYFSMGESVTHLARVKLKERPTAEVSRSGQVLAFLPKKATCNQ